MVVSGNRNDVSFIILNKYLLYKSCFRLNNFRGKRVSYSVFITVCFLNSEGSMPVMNLEILCNDNSVYMSSRTGAIQFCYTNAVPTKNAITISFTLTQ